MVTQKRIVKMEKHMFETVYRFSGPATSRSQILNTTKFFLNLPVGRYADWAIGQKKSENRF